MRELFAKAQEQRAKVDAAYDHVEKVSKAYSADVPPMPEQESEWPADIRAMFQGMTFGEFRRLAEDHPIKVWERKTKAEHEKRMAAYRSARNAANKKHGMSAAEDAAAAADAKLFKIGAEIFYRAADSLAGMLIKVRTIKLLALDDGLIDDSESAHWLSLMDDITEIAEKSGVQT